MYKINYSNHPSFCGLDYKSPKQLENEMNTYEEFNHFYFNLYRCLPDEECEFNKRRQAIKEKYPDKVIQFGDYYVLNGVAAYEIISAFYYSLSLVEDYEEDVKKYYFKRYEQVKQAHKSAQSLPIPIDLTEGQLGTDSDIEFFVNEAIISRQITVWKNEQ
jgi:hypothetical protein